MTDQTADHAAKQSQEAEKKRGEDIKKKLGEERKAREERSSKAAKAAGEIKPTPTQEENDLAASGVHVTEHEDDGSGPDPAGQPQDKDSKQAEANKPKAGYSTRASTPA